MSLPSCSRHRSRVPARPRLRSFEIEPSGERAVPYPITDEPAGRVQRPGCRRRPGRAWALALVIPLLPAAMPAQKVPVESASDTTGPPLRVRPVTVTVLRTPTSIETLTGSADVIGRAELDARDARTLEEAVLDLPGVNVVGDARYGQEVRINTRGLTSGFGTQRTLLLLDGRPLTDEYLGNVDVAQYPLDAMSRVELVRGPASALYGTNALGGVVNLVPRRGTPTPFTEVGAEGGTHSSATGSVSHGRRAGPVDLFLNASASTTDGYLDNSRGDPIDWGTQNVFASVGLERERAGVRGYGGFFHGTGTDEEFDRDLNRDFEDVAFWRRPSAGSEAETRLRLYRSALRQDLGWFTRPAEDYEQSSLGAILTQSIRVAESHRLTGGGEWRREAARVAGAGLVRQDVTNWAGFAQDEVRLREDLSLVLGLRLDSHEGLEELSYRGGVNFRPASGTILTAAGGRAFRAPTISDRFLPPTSFFGVTFEGNPDLDPEILTSGEAGVTQRIGPWMRAGVTGFVTHARDFWDFLPQEDGVFRPQNIASVNVWGVESRLAADLSEGLEAVAAYSYTDARYDRFAGRPEVEGHRLDDNVLHEATAGLLYRTPGGGAAHLDLLVSGDRFTDPENTDEGRLGSFYVVNAGISVPVRESVMATLEVENLTDKSYRTRPEFPQPGRAVFGGLRFRL